MGRKFRRYTIKAWWMFWSAEDGGQWTESKQKKEKSSFIEWCGRRPWEPASFAFLFLRGSSPHLIPPSSPAFAVATLHANLHKVQGHWVNYVLGQVACTEPDLTFISWFSSRPFLLNLFHQNEGTSCFSTAGSLKILRAFFYFQRSASLIRGLIMEQDF